MSVSPHVKLMFQLNPEGAEAYTWERILMLSTTLGEIDELRAGALSTLSCLEAGLEGDMRDEIQFYTAQKKELVRLLCDREKAASEFFLTQAQCDRAWVLGALQAYKTPNPIAKN